VTVTDDRVPVVPVGHLLGPVRDDDGTALYRVRVGETSQPLETAVEAAVWLAAHGFPETVATTAWTRQHILDVQPDRDAAAAAYATLVADGLLAGVDPTFADRYRVVPLTFGRGWQDNAGEDDVFAIGARERTVLVDETVLRVWECGAEHPTLRAACAAAVPDRADAALAAVVSDLHRLLAVNAVYIDVAADTAMSR
jgi:hypothetical protein